MTPGNVCAILPALAGALLLACSYPAVPAAWAQIDHDRPLRRPDVPYEPSSPQAIAAMIELARPDRATCYDLGVW